MNTEDLELITCHHCKKKFEEGEDICTISSRNFSDCNFHDEVAEIDIGNISKLIVRREINFHKICFTMLAGEGYVP